MPKILIVDDDPRLRKLLSDLLMSDGSLPFAAADGRKAVEMAAKGTLAVALMKPCPTCPLFSINVPITGEHIC